MSREALKLNKEISEKIDAQMQNSNIAKSFSSWEELEAELKTDYEKKSFYEKIIFSLECFFTNTKDKIEDFIRERKYGLQRMKKGFCDRDTWDIDHWFIRTLPKMLRQLAENKSGYHEKLGYSVNEVGEIIKVDRDINEDEHKAVLLRLADMIESIYIGDENERKDKTLVGEYQGDFNEELKDRALTIFKDIFFTLWD